MKKSVELEILIEAIKISLLEKSSKKLISLLKSQNIDWQRLEKLATFHSIRPVVYDAFRHIGFENEYSTKIKSYTIGQSIINLGTTQELARLLDLLQNQNIRVLPYKGLLFINELYSNQNLRETHDVDLLVHPEDAKKALKILINDGYIFDAKIGRNLSFDEITDTLLSTFGIIEVGLDKMTTVGINVHIDFHWRLYEDFYQYTIDFTEFFTHQKQTTYSSRTVFFPSKKSQFLMLLNHHGGRENWCRLKHFCDLITFLKTNNSFSNEELLEISTEAEMKNIFEVGLSMYQSIFIDANETNKFPIQLKIYKYWEIGELWLKLSNLILFEYIKFNLHNDMSFLKFISKKYSFFSIPNLTENPRLITFPKQFRFLNFCSKVITFVYKKTLKVIFVRTSN